MEQTQALDQFLGSVDRRGFRMAQFATRNRDDALDLVQEAMLKLVQKYGDRSEPEWAPLFYRILYNRIQDWHRRRWVRNRLRVWSGVPVPEEGEHFEQDSVERLADPNACDPVSQVVHKRATVALEQAKQDLPDRQWQAFFLRAWQGFDVVQTAKAMGCSEGSVKTHYFRAVHSLRERLGGPLSIKNPDQDESKFIATVKRRFDQSAEDLNPDITTRLRAARREALQQQPAPTELDRMRQRFKRFRTLPPETRQALKEKPRRL